MLKRAQEPVQSDRGTLRNGITKYTHTVLKIRLTQPNILVYFINLLKILYLELLIVDLSAERCSSTYFHF